MRTILLLALVASLLSFFACTASDAPSETPDDDVSIPADTVPDVASEAPASFADFDPYWSPDGSQLTFYSDQSGNFEVYVVNMDGTGRRAITSSSDRAMTPHWSPDGTQIAFSLARDSGPLNVYTIAPDGTGLTQLTDSEYPDFSPRWSPDGQFITFVERVEDSGQLRIMDADGSNLRPLAHDAIPSAWDPVWSPDGEMLAFYGYAPEHLDERVGDVFTMDIATGRLTRLTNSPANDRYPDWSPDGLHIAFASDLGRGFNIYTIWPDGSVLENITRSTGDEYHPAWSPDGSWLAFDWEAIPEDNQALYIATLPDAQRRRITP